MKAASICADLICRRRDIARHRRRGLQKQSTRQIVNRFIVEVNRRAVFSARIIISVGLRRRGLYRRQCSHQPPSRGKTMERKRRSEKGTGRWIEALSISLSLCHSVFLVFSGCQFAREGGYFKTILNLPCFCFAARAFCFSFGKTSGSRHLLASRNSLSLTISPGV